MFRGLMALTFGARLDRLLLRSVEAADSNTTRTAAHAALLLIVLVAMAYPFFWTDNENHYFQIARQWFDPSFRRPHDAAFDAAGGKLVGLFLFGGAVDLFGWDVGRLIIGLLSTAAIAWGFASLTSALAMSALDALVVLILFLASGQTVLGGEWFIGGIETKAFAYGFGLAGLAAMLTGRTLASAVWVVLALYFHFLVGAFWAGSVVIAALVGARNRDAATAGVVIAVLATPLLVILVTDWLRGSAIAPPPGAPSAEYIYSIIRNPHHVAPFAVPGWPRQLLAALVWAGACGWLCRMIAVKSGKPLQTLATLVAILCLFVPVALFLSWLDRDTGALGKLYLLRPFSPILLLGLFAVVAAWRSATIESPHVRVLPLLLTAGVLIVAIGAGHFRMVVNRPPEVENILIAALQRHVPHEAPVLLDPVTDTMTGIARSSGHQTVVSWKFVPTDTRDIYRWWWLIQVRNTIFAGRCPDRAMFVRFILAGEASTPRLRRCGRLVWQGDRYALIAVDPRR